jgi:hypothetical protein
VADNVEAAEKNSVFEILDLRCEESIKFKVQR